MGERLHKLMFLKNNESFCAKFKYLFSWFSEMGDISFVILTSFAYNLFYEKNIDMCKPMYFNISFVTKIKTRCF